MEQSIAITTFSKLIGGTNQLHVEAGTNCSKGGDSGSGGRTFLRLSEAGGTVWNVSVDPEHDDEQVFESPSAISITLGGDSELGTMIRALEFALAALKGTCEGVTQQSRVVLL